MMCFASFHFPPNHRRTGRLGGVTAGRRLAPQRLGAVSMHENQPNSPTRAATQADSISGITKLGCADNHARKKQELLATEKKCLCPVWTPVSSNAVHPDAGVVGPTPVASSKAPPVSQPGAPLFAKGRISRPVAALRRTRRHQNSAQRRGSCHPSTGIQ